MASGGLAEGITDGSGGGGGGVEMQSRNDTGMESSPSSHSVFVIADSSSSSPMEIDPIDDGPRINVLASAATNAKYMPPVPTYGSSLAHQQQQLIPNSNSGIATEDEARQCIELLRSDDVSGRVSAANRLDALALALGTDRTRNELLPFLSDGIDDEDEVLLAVARSIGRMVPAVGGPGYAQTLFRPLELLLTIEETTVREVASLSAQSILDQLQNDETHTTQIDEYAAMVARLASKEWFTARISAAGLIAAAYPRLRTEKQQSEHLDLFSRLCRDDAPMVRRVAARYLGAMVQNAVQVAGRSAFAQDGVIARVFLPLYQEVASNDQPDAVRLQTTENCVAFGRVMTSLLVGEELPLLESELALLRQVIPLIVATIDDRSWRVRWTAAAKFADVIAAYDQLPDTMDSLVPAYEKLLQDPEAEVRTAATFNLAHVAHCNSRALVPPYVPPTRPDGSGVHHVTASPEATRVSVAERLVKRVTSLTEDDSEHVRAALAMVATELATVLGKDATITYLVPPVLLLLRDAASEVRLNLISSLSALNEVIGVDLLSQSLLPAILDLAQDGKWRIRLAIIQHIPLLANQLGKEFFTEKLSSLCVGWLGDDIAMIRHAAAGNLKKLTALFGSEWAVENLIPPILEIREHPSYLRRLTALKACAMMATAMNSETANKHVLPIILRMSTDIVPNIRFNVAKELRSVAHVCGADTFECLILPVLTMLTEDGDRDVRYYAEQSIHFLDKEFANGTT